MTMKRVCLLGSMAVLGFATVPMAVHASEGGGVFVNADLGRADPDENDLESGNYWAVNAGYRWQVGPDVKLGVEGGYMSWGDFGLRGPPTYAGSIKIDGWTVGANLHYNFTPNWYLGARLGMFRADGSGHISNVSASDSDTGTYGGIGIGYDFTPRAGLALNYTRMRVFDGDAGAFSVNGEFRF